MVGETWRAGCKMAVSGSKVSHKKKERDVLIDVKKSFLNMSGAIIFGGEGEIPIL